MQVTQAQFQAMSKEAQDELIAQGYAPATQMVVQAQSRQDPTPAQWLKALADGIEQVENNPLGFTAHTVLQLARAANPSLELPGRASRDILRAVLSIAGYFESQGTIKGQPTVRYSKLPA